MKRGNIFTISILIILSLQIISAGGAGISPASYKEFFEPGLTKSFEFNAFSYTEGKGVSVYAKGDLAEFVILNSTYLPEGGKFTATINLPEKIEVPGTHKIYIGVMESDEESATGGVGGVAAVQAKIDIIVPYPGKYAESTFTITNINKEEEANYKLKIKSLGSQELLIKPTIEIYKNNMSEKLLTKKLEESTLSPEKTLDLAGTIDTKNFPAGEYQVLTTINWGEITKLNNIFRVGEFLIDITNYSHQFEQGKINEFNIEIENKWNAKINEVSASVAITDKGALVGDFKTVSTETTPWEKKSITGYLDATNLKTKKYTADITLSYGNKTTNKLITIYVGKSSNQNYIMYIAIAIAIIALSIYLILKRKNPKKKNGNKK
jgi:hypothetical protein